jgi:glc operon protein GlcG
MTTLKALVTASAIGLLAVPAFAQQPAAPTAPAAPPTTPYGTPITLDGARKAMAAAEAEAAKNNWPVAIAILDSTGHIVMLHKLDNTQYGSIHIAEGKAHTALDFRRPSKAFEDGLANPTGVRVLSFGITVAEGGVPITVDGKIVGAIGVSGVLSSQDAQVARAGADAVK